MENKDIYLLKYRWNYLTISVLLCLIPIFTYFCKKTISEKAYVVAGSFLFLIVVLILGIVTQLVYSRKKYHFLVDGKKQVLLIDKLFKEEKQFEFSEIKGVAVGKKKVKNSYNFFLQLTTNPEAWNQYYDTKDQLANENNRFYEEMYVTIPIFNQTVVELEELVSYLVASGMERRIFAPDITGDDFQGKPSETYQLRMDQTESPIVKKVRRRKRTTRIVIATFFIVWFIYLGIKIIFIYSN